MEGPFKFCLGPIEIQMMGAFDPQQKTSAESPECIVWIFSDENVKVIWKNSFKLCSLIMA